MDRNVFRLRVPVAALLVFTVVSPGADARAQSPPPADPDASTPEPVVAPAPEPVVPPQDARAWATRPSERSWVVLRAVGRGLGVAAKGVTWLVFAPFRGAIYVEARYSVFSTVKDILYNDAGTAGVLPSFAFASGFGVSAGVTAFHHDLFGHHETVAIKAIFGGAAGQVYQAKFELPELAGNRFHLLGRVRYEDVSNLFFAGIGNPPEAAGGMDLDPRMASVDTRYSQTRLLGLLTGGWHIDRPGFRFSLGASAIFNDRDFEDRTDRPGAVSIGEIYDTAQLVGFDDGVRTLEVTGGVTLDTRDHRGDIGSGIVATAFGGGVPWSDDDLAFTHYGAELAGYVTAFRHGRLFVLRLAHEGVAGDDDRIPFTDLPRVGGAGLLRGYRKDALRDRLSAIATVEYRYPIHHNLSGSLFVEAGEVAADYDALVSSDLDVWHLGYGGGLVVHTTEKPVVRLDLAYGDGFQIYFSTDVLEAFSSREKEL